MKTVEWEKILEESMSFDDYLNYSRHILHGDHRPESYRAEKTYAYSCKNLDRMHEKLRVAAVNKKLYNRLTEIESEWIWVAISEPWCGDASHIMPVFYLMSRCSERIHLRVILRDIHQDVMHEYLTEGAESIPKLICLEKGSLHELGTWGPRPKPAQDMVMAYKANPNRPLNEFIRLLHQWYVDDQDQTIQEEFILRINQWTKQSNEQHHRKNLRHSH